MENREAETAGESERLLVDVCRRFGAGLSFAVGDDGLVTAALRGSTPPSTEYEAESLPKRTREEACASVVRQLLCGEFAREAGLPLAASPEELRLRLEVMGPP